ncbi:MBL fold metallo-hydrolase [Roseovarius sp. LXJ103]|uniref:MBL fold metallo-hydrolase n=1 Tax=Roseovarius carneus TaxID=2853164 RepID=UPI000D60720C|nr:MBL fold metallo-hydrolase [Roseovarius carneus]MBZ8117412.1 MBL fold metallo-hydrolase [Roseovarius carneus]PWE36778.1 hypothetical protein DD563_12930 [Pelagicola sp. LXJ1103]
MLRRSARGGSIQDWYKIVSLAPGVFAIGEPRYAQQNWSYLICGTERALLFDTGSYYGEMAPEVAALTDLPLTVLPSHMHYDHLGSIKAFERVILPDIAVLRACAEGDVVTPSDDLFLPKSEGRVPPRFHVSQWLKIGARIDLGGRGLELLHTPGHSPDSVSLWWEEAGVLFAADYFYHGPLFAQVPGASLAAYLGTAQDLEARLPPVALIYGAHGDASSVEEAQPPQLDMTHLSELIACLEGVRAAPPDMGAGVVEREVCGLNWLVFGAEALRGFT